MPEVVDLGCSDDFRDFDPGYEVVSKISLPSVCAVMLTRDRPKMAERAIRCFKRQTYWNATLAVFNTGTITARIGTLRNTAIGKFTSSFDIIIHWDDDDWSVSNRIYDQVFLLMSSGADAVGFRDMLFWDTRGEAGEAWMYDNPQPNYCVGTSLCYWRETWEKNPFQATSQGEDFLFCSGINTRSTFNGRRMIASIHGANTSNAYDRVLMSASPQWTRSRELDKFCRERM